MHKWRVFPKPVTNVIAWLGTFSSPYIYINVKIKYPIIITQYILSTYVLECLSISAYNYTVKYAINYNFLDDEIFSNLFSVFCMFNTFPCIFSTLIALNNSNLLLHRGKVWQYKRPCLRTHIWSMSRTLECTFNTNWQPCQKQFYCGESQKGCTKLLEFSSLQCMQTGLEDTSY